MRPTTQEIDAARDACQKRFGHKRLIGITLGAPFDLTVILAGHTLESAIDYEEALSRAQLEGTLGDAHSAYVAQRVLWPSAEVLRDVREVKRLLALDLHLNVQSQRAQGWHPGDPYVDILCAASLPPGLLASPDTPEAREKAVRELEAQRPGAPIWVAKRAAPVGLQAVFVAPLYEMGLRVRDMLGSFAETKRHPLRDLLPIAEDHCLWAPSGGLRAHLDELPGRVSEIPYVFKAMGGASAAGFAERF